MPYNHSRVRLMLVATVLCCAAGSAGAQASLNAIRWDSTVAEVFPELVEQMDAGLRRVTLERLLSHTSGIPSDNDVFGDLLEKAMVHDGNLDELRYWLVQQLYARFTVPRRGREDRRSRRP